MTQNKSRTMHATGILESVLQLAGDDTDLLSFLRFWSADLPEEDFAAHAPTDWLGAAQAHQRLGQRRLPDQPLVRIYNPTPPEHGWQSSHTVVELVVPNLPFLVDTVSMALARAGYTVHLVLHPVLHVKRDASGDLQRLDAAGVAESWMHFEIDRETDPAALQSLQSNIEVVLATLASVIADWPRMKARIAACRDDLASNPPPVDAAELDETRAFLAWLLDDHFVILGTRDYQLSADGQALMSEPNSGHGLLRNGNAAEPSRAFAQLAPELRALAYSAQTLLILTKSDSRSTIHRPAYLDVVIIKRVDASGKVVGELRLLGLYTAAAYTQPPREVPVARRKIDAVLLQSGVDLSGHRGKAMLNILDTWPRDELMETGVDDLARIVSAVVGLHERNRVRVLFRDDIYRRYVSVMFYVARDNYTTEVRTRIQQLLLERMGGESCDFNVLLSDSPLARIHFIVRLPHGVWPDYDAQAIEGEIALIAQRWQDELRYSLLQHSGEEVGAARYQRYQRAFPPAYTSDFNARVAVYDIDALEELSEISPLAATLTPASRTDTRQWRIKLFHGKDIAISDYIPLLENLAVRVLDERPYVLQMEDGARVWIIDIGIQLPVAGALEDAAARQRFLEAFRAVFNGRSENDSFNRLVLQAGLAWREVLVLRAYARWLKQLNLRNAVDTLADCLLTHAAIARDLVRLFYLRHDPAAVDDLAADTLSEQLATHISALPVADDEKALGAFRGAIEATVRTSHFQPAPDGLPRGHLSLKIASARVPGMPQPAPLFEIFVYSTEVEGVHLRGGKVARGGLRWSDRRDDFRTEVLGLVKAQMVKNTVIVPVGSKGGFIVKNPPAEREAWLARGVECYKGFIRGLLDLTDNLVDGKVVPPAHTYRRDEDDPYLVVAADKGTATFSDVANGLAQDYGFWLDDAFASGGSVGYDHKKMGITARGAWVSVARHFRELGIDVATQPFTAIGIGDMSGDVFGNGMLRSTAARLVAAFDHRHIFIDPDPDAAASFKERERLYNLPRSSWADYDAALISEGGGVWPRTVKSIPLSAQMKSLLQVDVAALEPTALINMLLRAPVDLLYNGGIGTYVKASTQSQAEANDRGNDILRVDGRDLRCKVFGEGGNLGMTQLGRIEYALSGGRVFTDAIDNSAGVDCSDHEVNIKILLGRIMSAGDLTLKQRNTLLAEMTDDVGHLVLRDNELQTLALSLEAEQSTSLLSVHQRFMQQLEARGKLSRRLEYLPTDSQCLDRQQAGAGLTGPELAVLLAYAKMVLSEDLLQSELPDDPQWDSLLADYFPKLLVERFGSRLGEHPLRREIVATILTNHAVNRQGVTFAFRLSEEAERHPAQVIKALVLAEGLLGGEQLALAAEALPGGVSASTQYALLQILRRQTERATRWVLQAPEVAEDTAFVAAVRDALAGLAQWLADPERANTRRDAWVAQGVPLALAAQVLAVEYAGPLLELGRDEVLRRALTERLQLYLQLDVLLGFDWMNAAIEGLPRDNRWQALARLAARDDLQRLHARLVDHAWQGSDGTVAARLEAWQTVHEAAVGAWQRMLEELKASPTDLAMISAALREARHRLIDD
ncbi:glutamate dehydrogenase [Silvimonas terrae]|uniref:Glutamate dehydrogenase n=1 Tax=Silvimonas terrae TaxID=300266 RepID=A0A840RCD2_9NEIS|nr:NAD-glutamate dehydrogenase [Silvimonas terrae]MBB5190607.1 glutamate dehydrogenase [Silvimonas terrae]